MLNIGIGVVVASGFGSVVGVRTRSRLVKEAPKRSVGYPGEHPRQDGSEEEEDDDRCELGHERPSPSFFPVHSVSLTTLLALAVAAFFAGAVDAIGGGGGLIMVPALLAAGLPPHLALGTNKGQSLFGSLAAAIRYSRDGLVDRKAARVTFPSAFVGSLGGAALVLVVEPKVLRPLVLALLIAAAVLVTILRPRSAGGAAGPQRGALPIAGMVALIVGAYDGFFGPGAGTFYIAGFVVLLGLSMARASADAKVANFAS